MWRKRWASERTARGARLAAVATALAIVWLVLLPRVGRQSAVEKHIGRNEALGIDPSAKFFTELPAMPELLERIETAVRRQAASR